MNIRLLAIIFVCAAAPAIAFPLGIRVGSSWGAKSGPRLFASQDGRPIAAQPQPVRVIMSNTLDGQSIPGGQARAPEPARALTPVYPTSPSPEMTISASQGLMPEPRQGEGEPAQPKPEAGAAGSPQAYSIAEEGPSVDERGPEFRKRSGATASSLYSGRRYSRHHRHYRRFAHRRGWPSNPFAAFAGLFFR